MNYLVVGLGKSGKAAARFLVEEGKRAVCFDDQADRLEQAAKEGFEVDSAPSMDRFDALLVSPAIPPSHFLYRQALQLGKRVIGEVELALPYLHDHTIVAVTGTNGKTTLVKLIEHLLSQAAFSAVALGNIGVPLTSYLNQKKKGEIIVLELSSYQLETTQTVSIDLGVILNITPDHLDRYDSILDYAKAKFAIQKLIKSGGSFFLHQELVDQFSSLISSHYETYGTTPASSYWTDRSALYRGTLLETVLPERYSSLGLHESENLLAAWIVSSHFGIEKSLFYKALEQFKKPPHRIEFVASIDAVHYYNDSKATNVDATVKAVKSMEGKIILIAGGVDKGGSYEIWRIAFLNKVKLIILIGEASSKIKESLLGEYPLICLSNLKEAVEEARQQAIPGDIILLSPGCASYDMFESYVDRGNQFKNYVIGEISNESQKSAY